MTHSSEVYLNAPVVLVAAEVRFASPLIPFPPNDKVLAALRDGLAAYLPLLQPGQTYEASVAPGGEHSLNMEAHVRFSSRDQLVALTLRPGSLVLETTDYAGFEQFFEVLSTGLQLVGEHLVVAGVSRVGLRYIDEIRLPDGSTDWDRWLDSSLSHPPVFNRIADTAAVRRWQGFAELAGEDGSTVVVRYAPGDGSVLGPQTRRGAGQKESGPFFLLDIDNSWEPSGAVPVFDAGELSERFRRLHGPVRELFEAVINDEYRAFIRGGGKA